MASKLFDAIDTDRSGSIELEEFIHFVRTQEGGALSLFDGTDLSERDVREMMDKYDIDGNKSLDLHEFSVFLFS